MKALEDRMSFYAAYCQDTRNGPAYFTGAPTILLFVVAPIFLAPEVFFALRYEPALRRAVQRRTLALRTAMRPGRRAAA